jgi:hypothetical protein
MFKKTITTLGCYLWWPFYFKGKIIMEFIVEPKDKSVGGYCYCIQCPSVAPCNSYADCPGEDVCSDKFGCSPQCEPQG